MRTDFLCALVTHKIFKKPRTKVADVKKTGVELTMMESNRNQEVNFIGENILLFLYTRFVMSLGIGLGF